MSFDKIFFLNNGLNENDYGPGRAKYVGGDAKLVAVPEDRNSLKVKVIGFEDYIVNGRLTDAGFTGILNWLKTQPDIIDYYYKLNDLKNYFVVYEITKDSAVADKQVFRFTITERKTVPTLSPRVNHITMEELQAIQKGIGPKDLVVDPGTKVIDTKNQAQQTYGLTLPIASTAIDKNKNTQLVAFFRDAYLKVKKDANVSSYAGLAKVKTEINAGELGKATAAFLYALNAGFGIKDWSGEETEKNLTSALTSKISTITESMGVFLHPNGRSMVNEAADLAAAGFDPNAFVAGFDQALKGVGGVADTGGIVVPAEGFKYDASFKLKNAELQKFQEILMKNLPTYAGGALKNRPPVAAFLRTKADGIYGNKTRDLIGYLKVGLTDPKYPDNDNSTIKADFVNRMLKEFKLVQERKTYLGVDGYSIIIEGFDAGAADVASGISSGGNRGNGQRTVVKKEDTSKVDPTARFLQGKDDYSYFIKDKVWYYKKGNGPLEILLSADSIKKLIEREPNAGAHYIKIANNNGVLSRADKHLYKLVNKVWNVSLNGTGPWEKVNDPKPLIDTYKIGGTSSSSSGGTLSNDKMSGLAHSLILAMEGGGTNISEIVRVYKQIKSKSNLVALHNAFKKDGSNKGISLSYWLRDDLDPQEWLALFTVLKANGLVDELAKVELKYGATNPTVLFNTYVGIYQRAAKAVKK